MGTTRIPRMRIGRKRKNVAVKARVATAKIVMPSPGIIIGVKDTPEAKAKFNEIVKTHAITSGLAKSSRISAQKLRKGEIKR